MGKLDGLTAFLAASATTRVALTLRQVEILLGGDLPPEAASGLAWWSSRPPSDPLPRAWADAGFTPTALDASGPTVVFDRIAEAADPGRDDRATEDEGEASEAVVCRHPLFGAFKGRIWIEPGYDLTQPLFDDDWEDRRVEELMRRLGEPPRAP